MHVCSTLLAVLVSNILHACQAVLLGLSHNVISSHAVHSSNPLDLQMHMEMLHHSTLPSDFALQIYMINSRVTHICSGKLVQTLIAWHPTHLLLRCVHLHFPLTDYVIQVVP